MYVQNLNTLYVDIKPSDFQEERDTIKNLNTLYVDIKLTVNPVTSSYEYNLNTLYVDIKPISEYLKKGE